MRLSTAALLALALTPTHTAPPAPTVVRAPEPLPPAPEDAQRLDAARAKRARRAEKRGRAL